MKDFKKENEKNALPTQAAPTEKSQSPQKVRYGAAVFKGSLAEPEPAIVIQQDGDDSPEYVLTEPAWPLGYSENTTTVSVSAVDQV